MVDVWEYQIAHLTVIAKVEFLPATLSFVNEVSTRLGLAAKDAERLQLGVEEACINVIEHAFDPDEQNSFNVTISRKPGQIVVAVEDQGLPFDFRKFETAKESGLGIILMKAFVDEVHFLNLGRWGKRVELVKNLPYKDLGAYVSEEGKGKALSQPPTPEDIPITIRLMTPDDVVNVARCVYRCYGYTYSRDYVYFPDKMRELLESGLLVSYIALTPSGEVIGHLGFMREHPKARVGERWLGIVDPRYRSRGLLKKIVGSLTENEKNAGMYGNYSESVTVHLYSQKAIISTGAKETGVLLGFTPATMSFKKIDEGNTHKRHTAILWYMRINEEPLRDVYPPLHHQTVVRRICEGIKLNRNIISVLDVKDQVKVPLHSQVDVKVQAEASRAFMLITQYGTDLEELVKFRLRELCLNRIDCIYIDLPLSHPATAGFCASLEMIGFFFAGVIPELFDGDVLRLQYLNNVDIDLEDVQIASDFGKELFNYVVKASPPF